ncbi:hypothetical protein DSO57_1032181 [Entomophthora muscae]|uniref:Uncharacterized protein n=1 Tax=Entomophthora muscae TaxID=34485 RepID=A0ACC2UA55_9FUNG|nr:hypothetical protein DSO57_1032181 [Entomophthora muscae]
MGQIWAVILYEIYWNLRDKLGFTDNWFQPTSNTGNTLMLQLVIDAMKLQPCRPTFIQARNALLQAEQLLTGGSHSCQLWRGFAKRGLGLRATNLHTNSFEIPYFCFN